MPRRPHRLYWTRHTLVGVQIYSCLMKNGDIAGPIRDARFIRALRQSRVTPGLGRDPRTPSPLTPISPVRPPHFDDPARRLSPTNESRNRSSSLAPSVSTLPEKRMRRLGSPSTATALGPTPANRFPETATSEVAARVKPLAA